MQIFFIPSGNHGKQEKKKNWRLDFLWKLPMWPSSLTCPNSISSQKWSCNFSYNIHTISSKQEMRILLSGSSCKTWSNTKFLQLVCMEMCNKSRKGRINNQMLSEQFFFFFATFKSDPIRQNFSSQYQYNINQISDENKEKYQFGD